MKPLPPLFPRPMILALLLPLAACHGADEAVFENSADAFLARANELDAAAEREGEAALKQIAIARANAGNATAPAAAQAAPTITPVDHHEP